MGRRYDAGMGFLAEERFITRLRRSCIPLLLAAMLAVGTLALIQRGERSLSLLIGRALLLMALPLVALARRQLGPAFAVTAQAKGLVTHGLYAKIPHPMYVFVDLAVLGAIILSHVAWLLLPWALLVVVQAWEAGREARALRQAFGEAYVEYRKRTWW